MDDSVIRNYILEHRNNYPKQSIVDALLKSGITQHKIDEIYSHIDGHVLPELSKPYETPKKSQTMIPLLFAVFALIVPWLGVFIVSLLETKFGKSPILFFIMTFFFFLGVLFLVGVIAVSNQIRKTNSMDKLAISSVIMAALAQIFNIGLYIFLILR